MTERTGFPSRKQLIVAAILASAAMVVVVGLIMWVSSRIVWMSEFRRSLPNGYLIHASNADTTAIIPPRDRSGAAGNCVNGIAIAAKVESVALIGERFVAGFVRSSPDSEISEFQVPGYFLIDTEGGEIWKGLGEAEWKKVLQDECGVTSVELINPLKLKK